MVDKIDYRLLNHWAKSMMAKEKAPKTIPSVHGLISAAMNTAEMLGYIARNPCHEVQLPGHCGGR
ncbi:hypothetical protein [Pseudarthrobacter oxydans]|uniref:hypothetical protein n=1 Tax=Pseudarthrobacter oxydans TaxID=1671 RepID=UPI002AA94F8D|nr:hypothetical protein [Pseudarthrobacter oxydans]WPU11141.1 hypothetical protein SMD14_09225 [Pseudarthrobacter oxydans]